MKSRREIGYRSVSIGLRLYCAAILAIVFIAPARAQLVVKAPSAESYARSANAKLLSLNVELESIKARFSERKFQAFEGGLRVLKAASSVDTAHRLLGEIKADLDNYRSLLESDTPPGRRGESDSDLIWVYDRLKLAKDELFLVLTSDLAPRVSDRFQMLGMAVDHLSQADSFLKSKIKTVNLKSGRRRQAARYGEEASELMSITKDKKQKK